MSDAPLHLIALALFAEINARLDSGESRHTVLTEKGLSEDEFRREQQRWLQLLTTQADQQQWQLQQRYSAVYSQWRLRANAHHAPPLPSRVDTLPFPGATTPFTSGAQSSMGASAMSGTSPGFPGSNTHATLRNEPPTAPAHYEQPKYEQPKYEQPKYEQPKYEQPKYEQPKYEQPKYAAPPVPFPMPLQPQVVSPPMYASAAEAVADAAAGAQQLPSKQPVPLAGGTPYAVAAQQPASFPGAAPLLSVTRELVPFPGAGPLNTTDQAAFPLPVAPAVVPPGPEGTGFPPPAVPLFVSPKPEPTAFPVPAQPGQSPSGGGPPYFSSPVVTRAESFSAAQPHSPAGTIQQNVDQRELGAPEYVKREAAPGSPPATSPVHTFAASGYFVTNATGAWQASPAAADVRTPPAAPPILPLSFEQLTCLTAEIEADPGKAPTALAGYGIDQQAYQAQLQAMRVRCEADPDLQQRYDRLIQYYRAVVTQR